ncbi:acyl-CoA dehydrogenase [Solimonas sp. K1W22B-7]|uniref:acyl-CoA dehydrogenase family protein n=1 Tax=Solimonas sp. K1W22B-7 TaxID=2303331 RepID=UPI000E3348B4|nr:acyl-CoA dehydrogenase family protein [Solimonas sp. K1W22B-7]AXQ30594.1 acyl-CoA dehydrogenase [Solimonas sp. K1W22B-7]
MQFKYPGLTAEHDAYRDQIRRFVQTEIVPNVAKWDEEGLFPSDLHKKAAEVGILQLGYPEEYGGIPCADPYYQIILAEEISRSGAGGLPAGLMTHGIGLPPVLAGASEALKQEIAPAVLRGEKFIALGVTEPGGGSDVAALKTRAVRDGDYYVVNGSKTFITSGMRADWVTTAVRTGGDGMGGISLLVIPTDLPGFSRTPLKKMGWWMSDTATLYFDNVRVPVANRIGPENQGFLYAMANFNGERTGMAAGCLGYSKICYEYARDYAKQRKTFGKRLADHQVIRHKLARMMLEITGLETMVYTLATIGHREGKMPVAETALLKVKASETFEFCANEAMQILGGHGFMRDNPVERLYRETKVQAIGGGSAEIMLDLAARQYGI